MKIEVSGGYDIYRKKLSGERTPKSADPGGEKKASGADVVEISRGNTAIADKGLLTLKSNLQRGVSESASPERLEALRTSVRSGTYRISTEDLVNSILE